MRCMYPNKLVFHTYFIKGDLSALAAIECHVTKYASLLSVLTRVIKYPYAGKKTFLELTVPKENVRIIVKG